MLTSNIEYNRLYSGLSSEFGIDLEFLPRWEDYISISKAISFFADISNQIYPDPYMATDKARYRVKRAATFVWARQSVPASAFVPVRLALECLEYLVVAA